MTFSPAPPEHRPHVIPSWMVPLLALPIRKWWEDPDRIVRPLIQPGMRILEVGPGSGFFTLPMAEATGPSGAVACVELQAPVRDRLRAKLRRRRLGWAEVRPCSGRDLQVEDLEGRMDLAVAIDVLHEMPEPARALEQMFRSLRPGGRLLVLEPRGHCPGPVFEAEGAWAREAGFLRLPGPDRIGSRRHGALFERPR